MAVARAGLRLARTRVVAASAVALVTATACGSGGGTAGPSATGTAAQPDLTAILRYQGVVGPSQDPIRPQQSCEPLTLRVIFDSLFDFDSTGKLVPSLATGYEVRPTNVLRLTLRQGVSFQDGTPFNADAVAFNLNRVLTDPASTIKATLADLQSTTVVDQNTIDLQMKRAAVGRILPSLADRAGMMASPTAVKAAGSSAEFAKAPVGAGMYKVTGTIVSRQSMSVRRWDGYWDKTGQLLGGIDFSEIPFSSLVNAIQAKDVDWVSPQTVADGNSLKSNSAIKLLTGPGSQFRLLIMNETLAPFTDPRVRQAISYAIDREALAKALTQGTVHATFQEFPPTSAAYDPNLDKNPPFPHDPAKARALLQQAGVAGTISFDAYVGASATSFVQMGELIAAQLQQVGITMNVKTIDIAQAFPTVFLSGPTKHGTAQAASYGGVATADPDQQLHDHFLSDGSVNAGGNEAPGLRPLLEEAEGTADPAARAALYRQANGLVVQQVQDGVPIFFDPAITATQNYVGGVNRAYQYCDSRFRGVFISKGKTPVA
ncbi:MAG TPA: ABC transporter substrate-binding protein [Candidatus Dormibacteraeota bacterium]|nr:ABC transporter substrate-binding protein [Candidatus Dormibacteraeota bacterium]